MTDLSKEAYELAEGEVKKDCCETCRFWKDMECHVDPPNIVIFAHGDERNKTHDYEMGVWPHTIHFDWCGRHPNATKKIYDDMFTDIYAHFMSMTRQANVVPVDEIMMALPSPTESAPMMGIPPVDMVEFEIKNGMRLRNKHNHKLIEVKGVTSLGHVLAFAYGDCWDEREGWEGRYSREQIWAHWEPVEPPVADEPVFDGDKTFCPGCGMYENNIQGFMGQNPCTQHAGKTMEDIMDLFRDHERAPEIFNYYADLLHPIDPDGDDRIECSFCHKMFAEDDLFEHVKGELEKIRDGGGDQ